jgi:hypothetical protein
MSKDSEQRSYSVDEMMEKLKEGEREKRRSEESELRTRPDGSQVMRIRRHRRRSKQPASARQVGRKRRYGLYGLVAVVVLLVALAAITLVLMAKFNSKGYRENLKQRMLNATGAKVGISDLSVTPLKAKAKSVQFAWPRGGIAKTLKVNQLEADLKVSSFYGSRWKGTEVLAATGTLVLGPPDGTITPTVTEGEFPLDHRSYRCSNFDLIFGEDVANPALQFKGSEISLRPRDEGGVRLVIHGGYLKVGDWNELKVDSGLAELHEGRLKLVSLFTHSGEGEAIFRGVKTIGAGSPAHFDVTLKKFPLAELLGPNDGLGRLIGGTVEVPAGTVSSDPRFADASKLKMQFTGSAGTLEGFRFLSGLASILKKISYGHPTEGTIEGVFRRDRDGMSIESFVFDAKSYLKVMGSIHLAEESKALSGNLRVGIPEVLILRSQTELRYPAFKVRELGYCWINITLGGTIDALNDSFLEQLSGAPTSSAPRE